MVSRLGVAFALAAAATLMTGSTASATDMPATTWVPASDANFTSGRGKSITMVVIHKAEGSAYSAASWFQNPAASASAHYSVGDGVVYQMVHEGDTAWHAGNWDYNQKSIGIENGGYTYHDDMTEAHYELLAKLVANICERHGIPEDRDHIIGHNEVPDPYHPGEFGGSGHHTDPGPYWDWGHFMALVHGYTGGGSPAPMPTPTPPPPAPAPSGLSGVEVAASTLNVRTAAWGTIIGHVSTGDGFVATGAEDKGFVEIYFRGAKAWIYKAYTTGHAWWSAHVDVSVLNVRTGPGLGYSIVGHVHSGEVYHQISATSEWRQIQYDEAKQWVYRAYCHGMSVGG